MVYIVSGNFVVDNFVSGDFIGDNFKWSNFDILKISGVDLFIYFIF